MELEQSCYFGEVLQELPCTPREALVPGEHFVAVGKLCRGLTNFPLEGGREGAHYTHPPLRASPGCRQSPPEASELGTANKGSSATTRPRIIVVNHPEQREQTLH